MISTFTSGTAPNRIFVIDFGGTSGGGFYNNNSAPTFLTNFQIQLFETSNLIQVHTTLVASNVSVFRTMGIENSNGTVGFVVPGRNRSYWTLSNDGTQFAPGSFTYSWTPSIGLTPSATVAAPTTPALTTTTTYNVTVTDISGCSATGSTTVTVNQTVAPGVSIAASPGTTICAGTSVTFTATPTNGGGMPIYQWKKNGLDVGTSNASYTDAALVNGDVITCVLTSSESCASTATATSSMFRMKILERDDRDGRPNGGAGDDREARKNRAGTASNRN